MKGLGQSEPAVLYGEGCCSALQENQYNMNKSVEVSNNSNGVRSESKDLESRKLLDVIRELQDNRRISLGRAAQKFPLRGECIKKVVN